DGIFLYSGEGQKGDMQFIRGNLAVRDHLKNDKELHLFRQMGGGKVEYIGQMAYIGHQIRDIDSRGIPRKSIVFVLCPIKRFFQDNLDEEISEDDLWQDTLENLRVRAKESAREMLDVKTRMANYRNRSNAIRIYALKRADGICEGCDEKAPFIGKNGKPFLEVHHLLNLSDEGPDDPGFVAALCPNCHRRVHYGEDKEEYNKRLSSRIRKKES
ncbi:MAG: HNH endonuclease, partial [Candidatus Thorarchaeota archaeon]